MYIDQYRAYILGFLWADGSWAKDSIRLEAVTEDIGTLINYFKLTNWKWGSYKRKRKENWKETTVMYTSDRELRKFLEETYYKEKSKISHEYILKSIPKDYIFDWLRGYLDGDGCWSCSEKHGCYSLILSSTIEQDWNYLKNFLNTLGIKNSIVKRNKENSCSSLLVIRNKDHIEYLGNLLYKDFENNPLGLFRKYSKYLDICRAITEKNKRTKPKSSIYTGVSKVKNRWKAKIKINKVEYILGYFNEEVIAAKAYNEFILKNNIIRRLNNV